VERDGHNKLPCILKQNRHRLSGGKASLAQAKQELEAVKLMIVAAIKDNFSMLRSSERLMDLYTKG